MNSLLNIYRFLRSWLRLEISGGFTERFLNLCNSEGLYVWDTAFEKEKVKVSIYCADFFRLKEIRRKTGVSIKIIQKTGLFFQLKEKSLRSILILGTILSVSIMFILNQFIWCVEVHDTESISKEEILKAVEHSGLSIGTYTGSFDKDEAGREIINSFNGRLAWATVNIKGSKAVVEAVERTQLKGSESSYDNSPCNIVADFDGIIVSTEVFSGNLSKTVGNGVKKGDLLISGVSENPDGSSDFIKADGRITALHKIGLSDSYKKFNETDKLQVEACYYEFYFFGLKIPLSAMFFKEYELKSEYTELLKFNGIFLPFGYKKTTVYSYKTDNRSAQSHICCIDDFSAKEYECFKNTLILNSDYNIESDKNNTKIKSEYTCIDFIGEKYIISQEN